jgi:hypothetical protein
MNIDDIKIISQASPLSVSARAAAEARTRALYIKRGEHHTASHTPDTFTAIDPIYIYSRTSYMHPSRLFI